jgi:hypothetical protein
MFEYVSKSIKCFSFGTGLYLALFITVTSNVLRYAYTPNWAAVRDAIRSLLLH